MRRSGSLCLEKPSTMRKLSSCSGYMLDFLPLSSGDTVDLVSTAASLLAVRVC